MSELIQEQGEDTQGVQASDRIDMLADVRERRSISGKRKVYWFSPGWLKYWKQISGGWDVGLANETFPSDDEALLLDVLEVFDEYTENDPEKLLEFSDWMKIRIASHNISLERLKSLLSQQVWS